MSAALERLAGLLRERGGLLATLLSSDGRAPVPTPGGNGASGDGASRGDGAAPAPAAPASAPASAPVPVPVPVPVPEPDDPARVAASGPRTGHARAEYELLIEAIYEGYLLHYGAPRIVHAGDPDLGLLAGDQLYALGLDRLVRLGDVDAVRELADVITLCSLAQGADQPELAGAVWRAGARAIGWGASAEHTAAKELVRERSPAAMAALCALGRPPQAF
ncbi:MAG: hypothetical protein FWD42_03915 [Solirubrobacterales bacterium]|nr:hypothetical protein [Solirubrobacterales bacterium]